MDRIGQSEALELVKTLRSKTTLKHFEPRMDPPAEGDFQVEEVINRLRLASNRGEVEKAIETLVWLDVPINPESRVKIESRDDQLRVRENRPTRRLDENTAGITAPLNLTSIDLSMNPPGVAEWCKTKILNMESYPTTYQVNSSNTKSSRSQRVALIVKYESLVMRAKALRTFQCNRGSTIEYH